jgi:hypothetical protein
MQAMLKMKKIDIAALERAAAGDWSLPPVPPTALVADPHLAVDPPAAIGRACQNGQVDAACGLLATHRILLVAPSHGRNAPGEGELRCPGRLLQRPLEGINGGARAIRRPPKLSNGAMPGDGEVAGREQPSLGSSVARTPAVSSVSQARTYVDRTSSTALESRAASCRGRSGSAVHAGSRAMPTRSTWHV